MRKPLIIQTRDPRRIRHGDTLSIASITIVFVDAMRQGGIKRGQLPLVIAKTGREMAARLAGRLMGAGIQAMQIRRTNRIRVRL